jgi:hypothetical protein
MVRCAGDLSVSPRGSRLGSRLCLLQRMRKFLQSEFAAFNRHRTDDSGFSRRFPDVIGLPIRQ